MTKPDDNILRCFQTYFKDYYTFPLFLKSVLTIFSSSFFLKGLETC